MSKVIQALQGQQKHIWYIQSQNAQTVAFEHI